MQPHQQNFWILLTRNLSGEADKAEKEEFNQWLEEDQENRTFFEEVEKRWEEEPDKNTVNNRFLFDHESGISRLRYKIRNEKERKSFQRTSTNTINIKRFSGWAIAASILLVIGILSAWAGMHLWSPMVTTYETTDLEQRIITLPDNSTVRLNKNSAISFRKGLEGTTRKVMLRGEAFFDVIHDASRPFTIHSGDAIVRDIGTSFNVKQQRDGKIVVAMKEGIASLRSKNRSKTEASVLTKNRIGILNKGKVSVTSQEGIQNYLSWINGRLVFKEMTFDKVIRQLDDIYGIHSSMEDSSLAALSLTAYTNNTSLDEVLDMIALSLEIDYQKEGLNVIWRKKSNPDSRPIDTTDTTVTKA
jgi:ferric-dicitrate binding protein FerR (iron transport regulator)